MSCGPDYVPTEADFEEMFADVHPGCETCGERMCLNELESCDGDCFYGKAPGFEHDGLRFCDLVGPDGLTCADNARATLAEDIAREDHILTVSWQQADRITIQKAVKQYAESEGCTESHAHDVMWECAEAFARDLGVDEQAIREYVLHQP